MAEGSVNTRTRLGNTWGKWEWVAGTLAKLGCRSSLFRRVSELVFEISLPRHPGITPIFLDLESTHRALSSHTICERVRGGLCKKYFERDIVDTIWHASRKSATTRPNRPQFLLHEGEVWKDKRTESIFGTVGSVLTSTFVQLGVERKRLWPA